MYTMYIHIMVDSMYIPLQDILFYVQPHAIQSEINNVSQAVLYYDMCNIHK